MYHYPPHSNSIIINYGLIQCTIPPPHVSICISRGVGYILLTYRSSFILSQNPEAKRELLQPLGMKWIVFLLFLMFEPSLETIMDIIPFGLIVLLAIKCMLVLPENTLATHIYKKI